MDENAKTASISKGAVIVLTYVAFAGLWILLSDWLLGVFISEHDLLIQFSTYKGWFFVAVTSLVLFALIRRMLGQIEDIHQREVAALQAGQKNLELITAITNGIEDAIFAKDSEGRYLLINEAACRLVGKPRADILGHDDHVIFPHEQAERLIAIGRRVMATGQVETNEAVLQTREGEKIFLATKGPLRDAQNRVFGIFGVSRDVTKSHLADEALRKSEGRLLEAKEIIGFGYWHWDLRNGEHVWDKEINAIYGIPPEAPAVVFPEVQKYFTPNSWERLVSSVSRCVEQGAPYECDAEVVRPDGTHRWIIARGHAIMDGPGTVTALHGTVQDITERKLTEIALRDREKQLRAVLKGSDQGFWDWNLVSNEFVVSDRFETMLGYTPGEMDLRPENWGRYVHPEDLHVASLSIQRHLEGKSQTHEVELRCLTKSGEWSWILTRGAVVERDADGRPLIMSGTHTDINARKHAEEQLRKLSMAVEQSPESVIITNVAAEIEYVNDAFVRNTGYSREEAIGANPRILGSGKEPPATYAAIWRTLLSGQTWQGELCNRRKNGEEFIDFVTISPIRQSNGQITHYLSMQEDITERKRNEAELDRYRNHLEELVEKRTHELNDAKIAAEDAARAKGAFLANMSHEIRTPLNGVIGMTHLLRRSLLNTTQIGQLNKLEASARHLLEVLNAILDLSKIEAGKVSLEDCPLQPETIVANTLTMVEERARAKGLTLVSEIEPVPRNLRGDTTRLQQGLLNYASNAIKFTDHGRVTVRLKVLENHPDHVLLRFEVADTGVGIAPEVLTRLFSSFEQADSSTTRIHGGTGLGLAITKKLAELMGGAAGAESQLGQGSTFWFTARLKKETFPEGMTAQPVGEDARRALASRFAGRRILLAEDNEINLEVAVAILEDAGLAVDTARDGAQAVAKVARHAYALVLMDMQMPNLDGISATREIRRLPGRKALPVVAMTANAFAEDRARCLEAGMNDFISKPVDPNELYALILRWLTRPVA